MISNKKSLMLLVLKILEEYTDEEHYLTQQEIIRLIEEQYGLEFERKSIASSLNLLEELDYDIERVLKVDTPYYLDYLILPKLLI